MAPIFQACGRLTSLALSSCKRLDAAKLLLLAGGAGDAGGGGAGYGNAGRGGDAGGGANTVEGGGAGGEGGGTRGAAALPLLRELDLSYCPVPRWVAEALAARCTQLTALHLSGTDGAGCGLWRALAAPAGGTGATESTGGAAAVAAAAMEVDEDAGGGAEGGGDCGAPLTGEASGGGVGGSMLEVLSLVRCHNLSSMCLGLAPAAALGTSAGGAPHAAPPPPPPAWLPAPCLAPRLSVLRLGLSAVDAVALSLPRLRALELGGCGRLRELVLDCPALQALQLQGCSALGRGAVAAALAGCPELSHLDLQHTGWGSLAALQAAADEAEAAAAAGSAEEGGAAAAACARQLAELGLRHMRQQELPALDRNERRRARQRAGSGDGAVVGEAWGAPALAPPPAGGEGGGGDESERGAAGRGLRSVLVCGAGCPICSRKAAAFIV